MAGRNFEDGWVELDGLRFHYTEWGSPTAPGVLMLHGLNVQCHTWDPIARELAGDFHVICMDMRGHGDSDWAKTGYRVRSMARDVHGLIEVLGLGPVHLVGHSAGVRVAIAVAAERPETIRRLAVSDAGPANSKSGAIAMLEFIRPRRTCEVFAARKKPGSSISASILSGAATSSTCTCSTSYGATGRANSSRRPTRTVSGSPA